MCPTLTTALSSLGGPRRRPTAPPMYDEPKSSSQSASLHQHFTTTTCATPHVIQTGNHKHTTKNHLRNTNRYPPQLFPSNVPRQAQSNSSSQPQPLPHLPSPNPKPNCSTWNNSPKHHPRLISQKPENAQKPLAWLLVAPNSTKVPPARRQGALAFAVALPHPTFRTLFRPHSSPSPSLSPP